MRIPRRHTSLVAALAAVMVAGLGGLGGPVATAVSGASAAAVAPRVFVADATPTWQTDGTVFALAATDTRLFAAGRFDSVRPPGASPGTQTQARTSLATFDAVTGDLDGCAPSFTRQSAAVDIRALEVSADKTTLFVGGQFDSAGGVPVRNFAAINIAACRVLRGYPRFNRVVYALAASPSGVYVGGDFTVVAGQPRARLAAMTPTGDLLAWAPSADARVRALTVAPGTTRVYAGGLFGQVNGTRATRMVALDPVNGSVVQTFQGWLVDGDQEVKALAHDQDNVYMGAEGTVAGNFEGRLAADVQTGALKWKDDCLGATQAVYPYNGLLFSASHSHNCSRAIDGFPDYAMLGRQHLLANDLADGRITPWFPDTDEGPNGEGIGPYALTVAGGDLWVGGMFTKVNDTAQQGLVRFPTGPDVGRPDRVARPVASSAANGVTLTWRGSWDRDDGTLTYLVYRDGTSQPIGSVTADSRYWLRPTLTFTDTTVPPTTDLDYYVVASDGVNRSTRSPAAARNLMAGAVTSQSSTAYGAGPERAVDGNVDGVFDHGSVTHTTFQSNPWWFADLGSVKPVRSLVLWNRTDCCETRLSNFEVFLSQSPFSSTNPDTLRRQPGVTSIRVSQTPRPSLTLPVSVDTRYVGIMLSGQNQNLSLAEVQAYE